MHLAASSIYGQSDYYLFFAQDSSGLHLLSRHNYYLLLISSVPINQLVTWLRGGSVLILIRYFLASQPVPKA